MLLLIAVTMKCGTCTRPRLPNLIQAAVAVALQTNSPDRTIRKCKQIWFYNYCFTLIFLLVLLLPLLLLPSLPFLFVHHTAADTHFLNFNYASLCTLFSKTRWQCAVCNPIPIHTDTVQLKPTPTASARYNCRRNKMFFVFFDVVTCWPGLWAPPVNPTC